VLALASAAAGGASGAAQADPGASYYVVRVDPRLCPSPRCGGYFVSLANRSRTRCADGTRNTRCYVTHAVGSDGRQISLSNGSLVRARLALRAVAGAERLGVLAVDAASAPAGSGEAGSYLELRNTGIVCVRVPCFSFTARRLNGSGRVELSGIDFRAAGASAAQVARARASLGEKHPVLVRGSVVETPDRGRILRVSRIYVRRA
jgi:hypothetical protein